MDVAKQIRSVAVGMLVLAGIGAVCPQSAHGALAHEPLENNAPASAEHDHDGHDHGDCEYEIVHTHNVRMSCAPDELASHLLAGYAHLESWHPIPALSRPPDLKRGPTRLSIPAVCLDTVRLLL